VLKQVREAIRPEEVSGVSDSQLVRRWVARRDEAAFELLLWRHGPMVLDVCRRILRDGHGAEDAFQATFLALARKAGSITEKAIAGWLYRVAYRVALLAKARAAKQPAVAPALESTVEAPVEDHLWRDLRGALDREIARLPERYRVPVILCYFEGKTHEQAGQELGCPAGTIGSRLARARARLQARLTRCGIALTVPALTVLLSEQALASLVPSGLVTTTRHYGCLLLSDPSAAQVIPSNVHVLLQGAMRMLTMVKIKAAAIVLATLLLCGSGVATLVYRLQAAQPDAGVEPRDDALSRDLKLLQGRWQLLHGGAADKPPTLRSVKEISGNRETLRRYDVATNQQRSEHSVDFTLSSSGAVRVFTFYAVGGDPQQGRSFVYKVAGDDFYDIPGLLQGDKYRNYQETPRIWHWKRIKEEK
jgi:RNA polymerase sigma factor (sigma-70 family)